MSEKKIKVAEAKGRPMLSWVGKRPLTHVPAFPAQRVESFDPTGGAGPEYEADDAWKDWPAGYPRGGLLLHGDNKEVLAHLLANGFRGKVKLIYIDPPFDSGADYVRRVNLRGVKGTAKIDGETYSLGEQIQYTDIWANDNYLQFMYERLLLLRELLAEDGSIYVHCDQRKVHFLRLLLDEVMGYDAFVSEIIWQSSDAQSSANRYGPIHNNILYYRKGEGRVWNDVRTPLSRSTADNWYTHEETVEDDVVNALGEVIPAGSIRRFNAADLTARKRGGDTEYEWKGHRPPRGRYWAYSKDNMEEFDGDGRLYYSSSGRPYLKRYLDEVEGTPPQDLWTDISMIRGISAHQSTGYPTEKPEELLERILRISSNPHDLVLDCFIGSGTTAAVAQKLGRRWIGCDINKGAIQTTSKRLQTIIDEQIEAEREAPQTELDVAAEDDAEPAAAQLSFGVWRVNDYDLQVQHNEAVELACEHIGVERTRTDAFFDGVLGKRLVKIAPFTHPLSPADLDEVKRELEARPEEDRDVVVVCLGKELAADEWLEDWNKLRKARGSANRIEAIELRTDPKYGKFLVHRPAEAKVDVSRRDGKLRVVIEDFISPTIIERLEMDTPLFRAKIPDWRAQVDCVMIDPSWDGEVFAVALSDVPERRDDLVAGEYEVDVPDGDTTVAVKVIDMLGEEVVVTVDV